MQVKIFVGDTKRQNQCRNGILSLIYYLNGHLLQTPLILFQNFDGDLNVVQMWIFEVR